MWSNFIFWKRNEPSICFINRKVLSDGNWRGISNWLEHKCVLGTWLWWGLVIRRQMSRWKLNSLIFVNQWRMCCHSSLGNQLFNVNTRQSYISKPPRCSPRWCWPRGCLTSWMSRRQAKVRWASQSFPPLLYSQNNLKMARTNNRVDMGSIDKAGSTHHALSELCLHNYTLN